MSEIRVDKLTVDVIMHNFEAICKHMADVLVSTSYSPLFYDMNDFSTALFTAEAELMAQSIGCPVHLAAMPASVSAALKEYSKEELKQGDVILLNDPYLGGTHLGDWTFISPLLIEGKLVAFAATRAHVVDCGSAAPEQFAQATEIVQEGLRIPPVKIYSEDKPVEDVLKIILSHTRVPSILSGDIRASIAANNAGKNFLERLYSKYGEKIMETTVKEILNYAERRVRKAIIEIPNGTYTASDYLDTDGISSESIWLKATITVNENEMTVDWEGTSALVLGQVNRPRHAAVGDTMYALKALLDPKGPANSGWFRPINVIIPESCLLDARWPYPVDRGNLETTARIVDVVWQALAPAVPEKVIGMTYGYCGGIGAGGTDPRNGNIYAMWEGPPGGWGARWTKDGLNSTWHLLGNCKDVPIEVIETIYPIMILRSELITDSGGPGKFRGGLGLVRDYKFVNHSPTLYVGGDRSKAGPPGIFAGKPGRRFLASMILTSGERKIIAGLRQDGSWEISHRTIWSIPPNSIIRIEGAGGGGCRDPLERDPDKVLDDVIDEYISINSARDEYGVVVKTANGIYAVDYAETEELRKQLKKR